MSLYQLLKDNTQSEYHALLQHELISELMCPNLDHQRYHNFLSAHFYWFLHVEAKLTIFLSVRTLNEFGYKFKTPAIQKDLRHLELPQNLDFRNKQQTYFFPAQHASWNRLHWLGVVYALESILLIGPEASKNVELQLVREDVVNHLNIYGSRSKKQFIRTIAYIEDEISSHEEADQLVRGAQYTFSSHLEWLNCLTLTSDVA